MTRRLDTEGTGGDMRRRQLGRSGLLSIGAASILLLAPAALGATAPSKSGTGGAELALNHVGVARSTDGGRTWYSPEVAPLSGIGHPKLRVDSVTGALYVTGPLAALGTTYLTVSHNGGSSWSQPVSFPGAHFA